SGAQPLWHRGGELDRIRCDPRTRGRFDDRVDEGQRTPDSRCPRRSRRHHAPRRLSGGPSARQPSIADLPRRDRDFRAPPPPLRVQYQVQGPARAAWHAFFRYVARRTIAGDDRVRRPSLVRRRAVPPRAEIAAFRATPAVRLFRRRGGGPEPTGLISRLDLADLRHLPGGRLTPFVRNPSPIAFPAAAINVGGLECSSKRRS